MRYIFTLILSMCLAFPAMAESGFVTEDGDITIRGPIASVGHEEFTMIFNDKRIDVTMDTMNEDMMEQLIDSGIIAKDSFVQVTGEITDDLTRPVIKASTISLYGN